jgi:hypothetical protein
MMQAPLLEIITDFGQGTNHLNSSVYQEAIILGLKEVFPIDWNSEEDLQALRSTFSQSLPKTFVSPIQTLPSTVSFKAIYKYRAGAFKFFFEMISQWLVPGTRLNVVSMFACDFKVPLFSQDLLTLCDVLIHLENHKEKEEIQRSLPIIDQEVRLGVKSSHYARRILEVKGLSDDIKIAMVQEHIVHLIQRKSQYFEHGLISEMQHLLIMCRDKFKNERTGRHLCRIIGYQYLFRNWIREKSGAEPLKRHIALKPFWRWIQKEKRKPILSLMMGFNFLQESEIFGERHLLKMVRHFIPKAKMVEGSFFVSRLPQEGSQILYLEVEKPDGDPFLKNEVEALKRELPHDLEGHIEKRMPLLFMPRNEEEVMRNILSLTNQLRYIRDIPQVIISFDEQSENSLVFTVVVARLLKKDSPTIQELFKRFKSEMRYLHDRRKLMGALRQKYQKEATVFRLKIPKEPFERRDHSIDLYKARKVLSEELTRVIGEFRDFNGGMILKQSELLAKVRQVIGNRAKSHELLLDNFFYSLQPHVLQTVLEPEALARLFLLVLEASESREFKGVHIQVEPSFVYLLARADHLTLEEEIQRTAQALKIEPNQLAFTYIKVWQTPYLGYIYRSEDPAKQKKFCLAIECIFTKDNKQL